MDNEEGIQYGTAGTPETTPKPPPHRWDTPPSGPGEYGGLVIDMNNKPPEPAAADTVQYGKPKPSLGQDVARTVATQGAKGVLVDLPGIPAIPGQAMELLSEYGVERPMHWVDKKLGRTPEGMPFISHAEREAVRRGETPGEYTNFAGLRIPTGQRIERFWNENAPALAYEPEYDLSKYAGTSARFLSGSALLGPLTAGGMVSRGAQGAIAGLGSEGAGQLAHNYLPEVEPFARFVGAFAPSAMYSGAKAGASAARQAIAPTTDHVVNTIMGDIAYDLRAAGTKGGSPMTLDKFNERLLAGEPITLADIAGARTRARLAKYGKGSEEADALVTQINRQIVERAAEARQRLQQSFERRYQLDDSVGGLKNEIEAANRPGITRAYDLSRNVPQAQEVWSPIIADMFLSDRFKAAAKRVNEIAAIDETGAVRPHNFDAPGVNRSGNIEPINKPNISYFDEIKRDFDGQIRQALAGGNHAEARQLLQLKNRMVNELDRLVPEYKTARNLAAENFGAANAIDAGYFSMANVNGLKRGQMLDAFGKLDDAQKELFRKGAAYYLQEQMSVGLKEPKALHKLLQQREQTLRGIFSPGEFNWMVGDAANKALSKSIQQIIAKDSGSKGPIDVKNLTATLIGAGGGAAVEALLNMLMYGSAGAGMTGAVIGGGSMAAGRAALSHGERATATKMLTFMATRDPRQMSQASVQLGQMLARNPEAAEVFQKLTGAKGLPGENTKKLIETGARVAPFANPSSPAQTAPQQPPFYAPREGRKEGGRIGGINHSAEASSLIRMAERAKKMHNATTATLLNQPDETITRALAIADKAI